jgi:hypothetical protein
VRPREASGQLGGHGVCADVDADALEQPGRPPMCCGHPEEPTLKVQVVLDRARVLERVELGDAAGLALGDRRVGAHVHAGDDHRPRAGLDPCRGDRLPAPLGPSSQPQISLPAIA